MKVNIPEVVKFAGLFAIVATAFWCPNAQKVLILGGSAAITAGYFWTRFVKN